MANVTLTPEEANHVYQWALEYVVKAGKSLESKPEGHPARKIASDRLARFRSIRDKCDAGRRGS